MGGFLVGKGGGREGGSESRGNGREGKEGEVGGGKV